MTTLNYTCINGHKFKSKRWPTSEWHEISTIMLFGRPRVKATRCPICKTTILMCQSEDGKMGAVHIGFIKT